MELDANLFGFDHRKTKKYRTNFALPPQGMICIEVTIKKMRIQTEGDKGIDSSTESLLGEKFEGLEDPDKALLCFGFGPIPLSPDSIGQPRDRLLGMRKQSTIPVPGEEAEGPANLRPRRELEKIERKRYISFVFGFSEFPRT